MSLRNGNSTLPTKFMASIDSYDDASIVMAGVPWTLPAASDRNKVWTAENQGSIHRH